ncbi:hypothetical protein F5882DRAFT_389370 [Hyaloscypha sp. PMI_1271]|nr:hypothetical protein F5882DRAFT_389370 [Hyaloscypha sp. PMI_1271]
MSQPNTPDVTAQEQVPASISAAAHAYQVAMQEQSATPPPAITPAPLAQALDSIKDVVMTDGTPDRPASPAIPPGATNAPSPAPQRIGTPSRNINGNDATSRATSQHPDPAPTIPKEAPPHGAPTRQYLNSKVTGPLLDGMKQIAKEQPRDPLRALGEYLLQRSKELEGT